MSTQIAAPAVEREASYLRLLLVLLGTTTFFEGYDAAISAIVLPDLARSFGANTAALGTAIFVVGLGAFGALFITALGDRVGRRPLLIATTLLYAVFTGLTATAQTVIAFAAFQFLARMFLISELATAITIIAEEFPAERRGRAIGILTALGALGLVAVALLYLFVKETALGWRALYLIGLLPLLIVAVLRTKLRESRRWLDARQLGERLQRIRFRTVLSSDYRPQLLQVSLVFFFTHLAVLGASTWWTWFARNERGFDQGTVTMFLTIAYLLGISGYLVAGRLQDRIGRKPTGTIFLVAGMVFGIAMFQVQGRVAMFAAMALAVFFGLGVTPVLSAQASELFPTEIRATSVAFARSLFGTLGAIFGPLIVGVLADDRYGPIGNVGDSVSLLVLLFIPAALILQLLPETAGRELESIAPALARPFTGAAAALPSPAPGRPGGNPPGDSPGGQAGTGRPDTTP